MCESAEKTFYPILAFICMYPDMELFLERLNYHQILHLLRRHLIQILPNRRFLI